MERVHVYVRTQVYVRTYVRTQVYVRTMVPTQEVYVHVYLGTKNWHTVYASYS
jgi:hypothetical protein